jgi:hypothetical protein
MIPILRTFGVLALLAGSTGSALGATVSIPAQNFDFSGDTTIDVTVRLDDASGVAGVDFVVQYTLSDFAADSEVASAPGDLLSLVEVNPDYATDTGAGTRQIKVAAASAQGLGVAGGTLVTLSFDVTCLGNAQAYPTGRVVSLSVLDVHAFDELGDPVAATGQDGQLTLHCTDVPVDGTSLSTLKYLYRD